MDLKIQFYECNQCGAMIYPDKQSSSKGERIHIEKHAIPKLLNDAELLKQNDVTVQRFKGMTKAEILSTLKAEQKKIRNIRLAEVDKKEKEHKKIGNGVTQPVHKKVTRTHNETEITLFLERHPAVVEGDKTNGSHKCPLCGYTLASWNKK